MTEQFWVGGYSVNLSRNQITQDSETQTLQPKALEVLTFLAEHQGQVVSQEDLMNSVWKNTVVSPNTLQRCIAQLRKAFGDDSKQQKVIKTHAKKGYSLESSVTWHVPEKPASQNGPTENKSSEFKNGEIEPAEIETGNRDSTENELTENASIQAAKKVKQKQLSSRLWLVAIVLIIATAVSFINWPEPEFQISIDTIRPVTSTDNRELASIYSPDGKFVVFKRFPEILCVNNLWAKNLATQEEFQLTQEVGTYGNLSFSEDGKTLAFVKEEDCTTPVSQRKCYQLQSLNFNEALRAPQMPSIHMECKNTQIRSAQWLDLDEIALLHKVSDRWQLIGYSVTGDNTRTIYEPEEGNLYSYDYSPALGLLAVTSIQNNGDYRLEILKPDGEILSSNRIVYPPEINKFRRIFPRFSAANGRLVFSTGRQLFSLGFDGQISKISVPLDESMGTPTFHPDGKHMLAIKGYYDSDIATVSLSQFETSADFREPGEPKLKYNTIERSTSEENFGSFQPGGELIAFFSKRSGIAQIWVTDGKGAKQLSQFPMDNYIDGFLWAEDGQSLLVSASSQLKRLYLDGRQTDFEFSQPVSKVFHWDTTRQTVLATTQVEGVWRFSEIDLSNASVRVINNKDIAWAQVSDDGTLIYLDNNGLFWRPAAAEDQIIPELEVQGSHQHFILSGKTVYGFNQTYQLWSYDLEDKVFTTVADLPDTLDYITDVKQDKLLMTFRIAARKDVVELSLQ